MVVPCEYLFAGCFSDDLLAKLLAMALNLPTGMGQKLKYGLQKHAENAKKIPAALDESTGISWCRQPESNRHGFNSGGF